MNAQLGISAQLAPRRPRSTSAAAKRCSVHRRRLSRAMCPLGITPPVEAFERALDKRSAARTPHRLVKRGQIFAQARPCHLADPLRSMIQRSNRTNTAAT